MVELFTAGCFGRSPGVVNARSPASLRTSSPRRLGLNEVPIMKTGPRSPRDGLRERRAEALRSPHRFKHDGSCQRPRRGFADTSLSRSPRFRRRRGGPSDRSCGLFSGIDRRAFTRSSLRRTGQACLHASGSTRLRLPHAHLWDSGRGDESRSLRPAGEAGRPGVGVCVRTPRRLVADSGVPRDTVLETASRTEQYPIFWPKQPPRRPARMSQWDLPIGSQSLVTCGRIDDIVTTDGDSWMTLAT